MLACHEMSATHTHIDINAKGFYFSCNNCFLWKNTSVIEPLVLASEGIDIGTGVSIFNDTQS